jgi:hypothetical protein
MSLIQLAPQVKRHDLIFQLPDAYMPELKRAEARINELARQEYARIKADFDIKAAELEAEKAMLIGDMATIRDYCIVAIGCNFEWYHDQLFLKSLALDLELRQANRKIQTQADEMVGAWQASTEALLGENEGLRAEIAALKKGIIHIGKAKTTAELKERVREALK